MKDKRIYFVDDYGVTFKLPIPFGTLWFASRDIADVSMSDRLKVIKEFPKDSIERVVSVVVYSLSLYSNPPKEKDLFFFESITSKVLN